MQEVFKGHFICLNKCFQRRRSHGWDIAALCTEDDIVYCPRCDSPMKRIGRAAGFFRRGMQEHFNLSIGKPVSSDREYKNELRRLSEEHSERTGIPHDYQPVDIRDKETLGVTDEGLKATYDREVREGKREGARKQL